MNKMRQVENQQWIAQHINGSNGQQNPEQKLMAQYQQYQQQHLQQQGRFGF